MESYNKEKIREHWNKEAKYTNDFDKIFPLGYAGTYADYNLQHLEMNAILKYIKDDDEVLDIGCGKGYSSLYMVWKKDIDITGLDYAKEMVNASKGNYEQIKSELKGCAEFVYGDVLDQDTLPKKKFDIVYTERCLINITDWELQKKAIENISKLVKSGGMFLMQEGSVTSLDKLNNIRSGFNLEPINVVWHNKFFDDVKLSKIAAKLFDEFTINDFSSIYSLISRVINPALVYPDKPSYDAKINKIALGLPNHGDYGYQKIYVFKKNKN